jgi:hypothetical protein
MIFMRQYRQRTRLYSVGHFNSFRSIFAFFGLVYHLRNNFNAPLNVCSLARFIWTLPPNHRACALSDIPFNPPRINFLLSAIW